MSDSFNNYDDITPTAIESLGSIYTPTICDVLAQYQRLRGRAGFISHRHGRDGQDDQAAASRGQAG